MINTRASIGLVYSYPLVVLKVNEQMTICQTVYPLCEIHYKYVIPGYENTRISS